MCVLDLQVSGCRSSFLARGDKPCCVHCLNRFITHGQGISLPPQQLDSGMALIWGCRGRQALAGSGLCCRLIGILSRYLLVKQGAGTWDKVFPGPFVSPPFPSPSPFWGCTESYISLLFSKSIARHHKHLKVPHYIK